LINDLVTGIKKLHLFYSLFHIESFTQIPADMKRGILILFTAFLIASATFSSWYVAQQNINQRLYQIELQLSNLTTAP
jgi:hypothetical protein